MTIKIEIDCQTIQEFNQHLDSLKIQIKKETKRLKLNPVEDEFPKDVYLNDNNCYGTHEVKIIPA